MALAYEYRLARTAVRNRRGAWTTYGSAGTWESILLSTPGQDPLELLKGVSDVATVSRDVTDRVYSGQFTEPDGGWLLVVHSKYQDWVWLVGTDALLRDLAENAPGRWLRTGHADSAGVVYVEVRENGKRTLFFSTDGEAWDEPEDDEDELGEGILVFETDDYEPGWPLEYATVADVHQQLLIDLDAYVPFCFWDDGLVAMHGDAIRREHVKRIDLVEFGGRRQTLSPSAEKRARILRYKFRDAILNHDLHGAETALAKKPDLSRLPKISKTTLGFAAYCVNFHHPQSAEIVKRILAAGADPNDGGAGEPTPVAQLVENDAIMPIDRFDLLEVLVKSGADINRPSPFRWGTGGRMTPLEYSLEHQKLAISLWLLNHGAMGATAVQIQNSLKLMAEKTLKQIRRESRGAWRSAREDSRIEPPRELVKGLEKLREIELNQFPPLSFANELARHEHDLIAMQLPPEGFRK